MKDKENQKRLARRWYEKNRALQISRSRQWALANPLSRKATKLKQYGLTVEQFEAMVAAQAGHCAICHYGLEDSKIGTHVDHDHKTKVVRGLLCGNCNTGLGQFKENPNTLRRAASYIEKHKCAS